MERNQLFQLDYGIQAKDMTLPVSLKWRMLLKDEPLHSVPLFFEGLYPLVRVDDDRFKNDDLATLNSEDVTFATQDNDSTVQFD